MLSGEFIYLIDEKIRSGSKTFLHAVRYGYKITCTDLWLNKGTSSKGDFLLLRSLKQNLDDHRLEDDWEVKTVITAWLIAHGMDWYRHGTEKLVSQCDKGFSYCWDYVETQWHSLAIKFWTVFFSIPGP